MEQYVIGIDLGTGSAKALAMNFTGDVIDTAQVAYPTYQPAPGYQEQSPELIWQAFVKCIRRISESRQRSPDAICLSSAMHSVIPVDVSGRPLMNMIIWADNRSAANATRIHHGATGRGIYEQTGTPIHAMTPLCKIQWLQEHEPALFQKTTRFISIKEYVWFMLFRQYEVDYSIASATGLMDIDQLAWSDIAMQTGGISAEKLSTLVNTHHLRRCDKTSGNTLGVNEGTPVIMGSSDGCLANAGSFATEEGFMALTIGTSGAVRVARTKPMRNFRTMTFNYLLDENTFISGGPTNNGGVALRWFAEKMLSRKLESAADYALLLKCLSETQPGAEGLVFLPYLLGERAPIWNSDACGAFFGMRSHHDSRHFTRAVVEGISMALYDITHGMLETGLSIEEIHVSGGFVRSEEWLQILSDIFGRKICLINTADASATGAAFLAMKVLGVISDYDQLKPKEIREFLPREKGMEQYQELYKKYRSLYESVAHLMTPESSINQK